MTSPKDREPTEAMQAIIDAACDALDVADNIIAIHCGIDTPAEWNRAFRKVQRARAMVTASPPVDHGRVEKLEAALEANAVALNAFIECVGHKMADSEHYRWCRLPTFAEVQDAMIANNAARALTNKDTVA